MRKNFTSFTEWKVEAEKLGWVHVHDQIIVCDDEYGNCIGEWGGEFENGGWLEPLEDIDNY